MGRSSLSSTLYRSIDASTMFETDSPMLSGRYASAKVRIMIVKIWRIDSSSSSGKERKLKYRRKRFVTF